MVKKWLVVPFLEDLFHGTWMMVLFVKSTAFAQMERKMPVQCFTVLHAVSQNQWDIKGSSHTFLNPKTAQALKQATLFVKALLVERIGQAKETVGKLYQRK